MIRRYCAFLSLLLAVCALISGCSVSSEPEHQAYAITLSVDKKDEGYTLGVQIPSITGSTGGDQGGGKADSYAVFTATGAGFTEAFDVLRASLPNPLRLSHLKSIVVSEQVASDPSFPRLTEEMMLTHHLYGASQVLITSGKAEDFLSAQNPVIGTRLSSAVTAAIDHFHENGYIPETTLYELYALNHSFYSDPILAITGTADESEKPPLPAGTLGMTTAGYLPRKGDNKNEYIGAALMKDGVMVGKLNGYDTRLLLVIRDEISIMDYICQNQAVSLTLVHTPKLTVDVSSDPMRASLSLRFYARPLIALPDMGTLEALVKKDVVSLLETCKRHGVEPFGFHETASSSFSDINALRSFHFSQKFSTAQLSVSVKIEPSSA